MHSLRTSGALLLAVAAALLLAVAPPALAAPAGTDCSQNGSTSIEGGQYIIQDNEWNSSAQQCITYTSGTAWSVSTANFTPPGNGAPNTYPSIFAGCHWGNCTTGSGMPIQVSNLGSATTSWSTSQPASGAYDVAYDIWYNQTPTTTGQPDGTEMMVWLNHNGSVQPFGSEVASNVSIGGHSYEIGRASCRERVC